MRYFSLFLGFCFLGLWAQHEGTAPSFYPGDPLPSNFASGYSQKARVDTKASWDLSLQGSFNYLYASQDEMDFAITQSTLSPFFPSACDTQGPLLFQDFTYKPGFSVSACLNTSYDHWSVAADYLWYRGTTNSQAVGAGPIFYRSRWLGNGFDQQFGSLSSEWTLGIDQVDLAVLRPFYSGRRVLITPSGGLRALWIRQKISVHGIVRNNPAAFAQRDGNSNSWAIGPVGGIDTNWLLYSNFSLIAKGHASLVYTRYTTLRFFAFNQLNQTGVITMNDFSTVRPMADLSLGLSWGRFFDNESYYLNFQALYSFMAYFSQNMLYSILSPQFEPTANPGSLYLNGLTLSAAFLF